MAEMNWDKFDKQVDVEGLRADVEEAKENGGGDFEEVPHGEYEVAVDKMELTTSKKGDPMVSIWFKIVDGNYANNRIFYNQVITRGFQIHFANELLRGMDTGLDIEFESYGQYADLLLDVAEEIDAVGLEFALDYQANPKNKDFSTFDIVEVFETE